MVQGKTSPTPTPIQGSITSGNTIAVSSCKEESGNMTPTEGGIGGDEEDKG